MTNLSSRAAAIRAYIDEQAALGVPHSLALARREWDRIGAAISAIDSWTATEAPAEGEWSVAQVVEHMLLSLQRNRERFEALYDGREFRFVQQPGQLPAEHLESFEALRDAFLAEASGLSSFLASADASRGSESTADHAAFGAMTWPQWAAFLHVHARDHANQVEGAIGSLLGR